MGKEEPYRGPAPGGIEASKLALEKRLRARRMGSYGKENRALGQIPLEVGTGRHRSSPNSASPWPPSQSLQTLQRR